MVVGLNVAVFLILQIGTALSFKWGAGVPHLYWWGFLIGNIFGLFSTLAYINVFKYLSGGTAVAICAGGSFVAVQFALTLVYWRMPPWPALFGALMILGGIFVMAQYDNA